MKDDHGTIHATIHVLTFMVLPILFLAGAVYLLSIIPNGSKEYTRCFAVCAPYVYTNDTEGGKCVCDNTKELR